MRSIFDQVNNWGRWGAEDGRGALNHITPELIRAAARLVETGRPVSLARDFPTAPGPANPFPAQHYMIVAGDACCPVEPPGLEMTADYIGIAFHGLACTHLDSLCHMFADGRMYGGFPTSDVKSTGALRGTVMDLRDGVVSRGVLLDIPRALGKPFVAHDEVIGIEQLELAERTQQVRVGTGDVLVVRMGRDVRPANVALRPLAGLHPEVIPWLHAREVAALGGDGIQDPGRGAPKSNDLWSAPIHVCGLASMGLHLLDNLYLEDARTVCEEQNRWAFQICIAPLRIQGGTGSPVNPIALF